MPSVLLVYALISLTLAVLVLFLLRGDEPSSHRLARVRVRVDDHQRTRTPERPDDDFEMRLSPEWIFIGTLLLLIFLVLGKA